MNLLANISLKNAKLEEKKLKLWFLEHKAKKKRPRRAIIHYEADDGDLLTRLVTVQADANVSLLQLQISTDSCFPGRCTKIKMFFPSTGRKILCSPQASVFVEADLCSIPEYFVELTGA